MDEFRRELETLNQQICWDEIPSDQIVLNFRKRVELAGLRLVKKGVFYRIQTNDYSTPDSRIWY